MCENLIVRFTNQLQVNSNQVVFRVKVTNRTLKIKTLH